MTHLSMPDPCPHITRLDIIAARVNGKEIPTCTCTDAVIAPSTPVRHEVSITRDRPTRYAAARPLRRLRCLCGWHTACEGSTEARMMKNAHLEKVSRKAP